MKPLGLVCTLVAFAFSFATDAPAQTASQPAPSRLEVGAQAGLFNHSRFDKTTAGIGGRLSFDVTRWLTAEGEATFFPDDDIFLQSPGSTPGLQIVYPRKRTEAFFGMKAGVRNDRVGLFAKARPGFTDVSGNGVECVGDVCALALLIRPAYNTEFALDLGGVFEFYPSRRIVARFDLGDTMIWHNSVAPPCWTESCTSHNLSSKMGVGLRF
jgi:hypothetical protein